MGIKAHVTSYGLNVRSTPNVPAEDPRQNILTAVWKNFVVDKLDDSPDGNWCLVEFTDRTGSLVQGWVSQKHLKPLDVALFAPDAPSWIQIAVRELGVLAYADPGENPRIKEYLASTRLGGQPVLETEGDEIPWCSSFLNWCMIQAGYQGPSNAHYARSWLDWEGGAPPQDGPQLGCIAVFKRADAPDDGIHGHVAFYVKSEGDYIQILGGNQGLYGQVNVQFRHCGTHIGYVWPH